MKLLGKDLKKKISLLELCSASFPKRVKKGKSTRFLNKIKDPPLLAFERTNKINSNKKQNFN